LSHVSFLVAGVQKGGTSALHDYLGELPGLQLPAIKEAHFFDDEERVDWSAPNPSAYHDLFVPDGRLWGEATPIYLYWPNALERVARYNPAMRLILIFRDPVQRAWSQWKMEYAKGKERAPFAWCIRDGRARMADAAPYPGVHRVYSYVERGFYGAQLDRALTLFPREQLLLLRQDDLAADPDAVLTRVAAFLDVAPPAGKVIPRRVREARTMPYPSELTREDVTYLQRVYAEDAERFAATTGFRFAGN
jgi:hypothetical protein